MIPQFKACDTSTKFNNNSGSFMANNDRHWFATLASNCNQIRMTQANSLNLDKNFTPIRRIKVHLLDLQRFTVTIRSRPA
jgi:hypothetical protein